MVADNLRGVKDSSWRDGGGKRADLSGLFVGVEKQN